MLNLDEQNALREQFREANPGWRPATEVYAELVRSRLSSTSRSLDLGCGRGGLVEQLESPRPLVIGLDPDLDSLREHRLASSDAPMPRAAGLNELLPFKDGSFDLIFASWVLEHIAEPEICFTQIGRALGRGGAFVFITPNRRHPLVNLNRLTGGLGRIQNALVSTLYGREREDTFPAYYRANTKTSLESLARQGGMRLVKLETIADPTYLSFHPKMLRAAQGLESRLDETRRIHLVGLMDRR